MNLVRDILSAYRSPRKAIRQQLDAGVREEQSLLYVMLFGLMNFVSHLPNLAKQAQMTQHSLASLSAAQFVSSVFMMPLVLYLIAAVAHALMRAFKGKATYGQARRVLFWAALVTVPFILILGLVSAFASIKVTLAVSVVTLLVFSWQWASGLAESEFPVQKGSD